MKHKINLVWPKDGGTVSVLASQVVVIKSPEGIGFTKGSKSCGWLFQLALEVGTTTTCKLSMVQVLGLWVHHIYDTVQCHISMVTLERQ